MAVEKTGAAYCSLKEKRCVNKMNSVIRALALLIVLTGLASASGSQAIIYENEACGHCQEYLTQLTAGLASIGYTNLDVRHLINNESVRGELYSLQQSMNVPLSMQGHLVIAIDGKYLFEGHVPVALVEDFLVNKASKYPKGIVVTQDLMLGATSYKVFDGTSIKQYPIDALIGSGGGVPPASGLSGLNPQDIALPAFFFLVPLLLVLLWGRKS